MITFCGQLVTSTSSNQDLRDWVESNKLPMSRFFNRRIYLCPKSHLNKLVPAGAIELPRYLFNASAWWSSSRTVKLLPENDEGLPAADVRVRDVTTDGRVIILHPQVNGMKFVEVDELSRL